MKIFNEVVEANIETLQQYVPIVDRVHGDSHPEFHDVKRVFDEINSKLKESQKPELTDEFKELRKITENYTIPEDVCESYEAVYKMLEDLDKAYAG
mgnify:FL=1